MAVVVTVALALDFMNLQYCRIASTIYLQMYRIFEIRYTITPHQYSHNKSQLFKRRNKGCCTGRGE